MGDAYPSAFWIGCRTCRGDADECECDPRGGTRENPAISFALWGHEWAAVARMARCHSAFTAALRAAHRHAGRAEAARSAPREAERLLAAVDSTADDVRKSYREDPWPECCAESATVVCDVFDGVSGRAARSGAERTDDDGA